MDGTYLPVFNRLLDGYGEERQNQLVKDIREVVGIIILLESPLSVTSLAELTSNTIASINARLSPLHTILKSQTRKISHPTTDKEFRFWVDEKEMNQRLTAYCLYVMRTNLKKNICSLQSYGTERTDIDPKSISHYLPPELQYSCRYWTHHLARSKDLMTQTDNVLAFFEEHFLHWVEVLSILGHISEAVEDISALQSAVQLYASGLFFAPRTAITRRNFKRELLNWIYNCLSTLEGHSSEIWSVTFSPDGRLLVSGSGDTTIKLWDATTGTLKHTLEGHSGWFWSVAFSPDGRVLVSGSDDKTIKLWDPATGALKHTMKAAPSYFQLGAF
ncbi:hypothetical protein BDV12DRAFT_211257 [Aspergillus spectabilis]